MFQVELHLCYIWQHLMKLQLGANPDEFWLQKQLGKIDLMMGKASYVNSCRKQESYLPSWMLK